MKKYTFRLEGVRRVRRMQEEVAKGALLTANSQVQKAKATVESRIADYEATTARNAITGVAGTDVFMKGQFFSELASQSIIAARQAQAAAEEVAAQRRFEWSEVAKQVKVLDRLDERRREEYRIEHDREVEKEVDDIVTGRALRAAQ